ncbi:MAG: putative Rossmann fold flavoprotein [Verrucomicrobiales bacterium]|jgi:predicted Rossmann fold flavoprotein
MIFDLIIVGGGAAGFFGAITHVEACGGSSVILEKSADVLTKVRISGGGRCNVTHDCFDARELSKRYPRGEKALIGPLNRWGAEDTVRWFHSHGVELKTEADGRMFPTTDSSQSIIDCLQDAARRAEVEVRTGCGVAAIRRNHSNGEESFAINLENGKQLLARNVLIATGGTRLAAGAKLAESLGHSLVPAVPSLFTFKINDPRIRDLQGLSVAHVESCVVGTKLAASGPLLITHWGMSGPGILKLSAWGARVLAESDYKFQLKINWLPQVDVDGELRATRERWGRRQMQPKCPFAQLPRRLWQAMLVASGIQGGLVWSQLTREQLRSLVAQLTDAVFEVKGKSLNKEEFVTCGGVPLKEINMKTMESKCCPGLYFAGEVMDIDGITGGFNFQNAWTSGHLAGMAIADLHKSHLD